MADLLNRIKYAVACLLDRSPRTCWTNLVCWVQFGRPLRQCWMDDGCRRDAERCGRCYCGKLGGFKPDEEAV